MFRNFLKKLKVVNKNEYNEWQELLQDEDFKLSNPKIAWYLSSGIDLKALVHLNEKDSLNLYHSPVVDFFIYSDYSDEVYKKLKKLYYQLDNGEVILFKDKKTKIYISQMIPLKYFSNEKKELLNKKYAANTHFVTNKVVKDIDFFYCLIEIESDYFGEEYFNLLISPNENWVLLEEIFKKENIKFDYFIGVTDGCRKGGAYKCVNYSYKEFLPVAKKEFYWITDHGFENNKSFEKMFFIKGWGRYGKTFIYKNKIK